LLINYYKESSPFGELFFELYAKILADYCVFIRLLF